MLKSLPLAILIIMSIGTAALAAPKDVPGAYVGKWTLGGDSEGDPYCTLAFGKEQVIGGWAIKPGNACSRDVGLSGDVAAWTVYPDGSIGFIDPLRKVLVKFSPIEAGGYAGQIKGLSVTLDRDHSKEPVPTEQQRMSGAWNLVKMGGDPLCSFRSAANKAGTKGTLTSTRPCKTLPGVVGWERAKGRLMFLDTAGKTLLAIKGDSIEGFDGDDAKGDYIGFTPIR